MEGQEYSVIEEAEKTSQPVSKRVSSSWGDTLKPLQRTKIRYRGDEFRVVKVEDFDEPNSNLFVPNFLRNGKFHQLHHVDNSMIEDDKKLRISALAQLEVQKHLNVSQWKIDVKDVKANYQIRKFFSSLEVWSEMSRGDAYNVAYRSFSEGSAFADYCKKARLFGFLRHHRRLGFAEFEEYPETKSYVEVFPESHLPFWTEPECKDIENMFEPRKLLTKELRAEFLSVLKELPVPRKLKRPQKDELNLSFRAASTYHKDKILGIAKLNEVDVKLTTNFDVKRSVVKVSPANVRDAIVVKPDTLYTISVLDSLIMQIIRKSKESAMVNDGEIMNSRINFMYRRVTDGYYSYVRDIKKCGLTMNPELFDIIREWAEEEYPDQPFSYLSLYNNMRINIGTEEKPIWKIPRRGHGLGMANALTTLVQIVLFKIALKREESLRDSVWGIFFNDDSLVCSKYEKAKLFYETDQQILKDYQLPIKLSKTGIIREGAVFCEKYISRRQWDAGKEVLTCMAYIEQKFAVNITAAKFAVRSMGKPLPGSVPWKKLCELISFWGYEFHKLEIDAPSSFGGWTVPTSYLDPSLRWSEFSEKDNNPVILKKILHGENADVRVFSKRIQRQYEKKIRMRKKVLQTDNLSFIPGLVDQDLRMYSWDHEYHKNVLLKALQMRVAPNEYWVRLHTVRQNAYQKRVDDMTKLTDVVNDFIKYHPQHKFHIPRQFWKEEVEINDQADITYLTMPDAMEILEYDKLDIIASKDQHEGGPSTSFIEYKNAFEYIKPILDRHQLEGGFLTSKVPFLNGQKRVYEDYVLNPFIYDVIYVRLSQGIPKTLLPEIKLPEKKIVSQTLLDDLSRKVVLPPWIQKNIPLYQEIMKILKRHSKNAFLGQKLLWEIDEIRFFRDEEYEPAFYADLYQYERPDIPLEISVAVEELLPDKPVEVKNEQEVRCVNCETPFLIDKAFDDKSSDELLCEACLSMEGQEYSVIEEDPEESSPAEHELEGDASETGEQDIEDG